MRLPSRLSHRWTGGVSLACLIAFSTVAVADQPVDFARSIQPLLASRCYACHGPDQAESGLKLTEHQAATAECDSGDYAIVPGDASSSVMMDRITSTDEFERMPPEGEPLDDEEVALLKRWIDEGAAFTPHWAFRPISDPPVPPIDSPGDSAVGEHPIDAFIRQGLENAGLTMAAPADRRTLIRRATHDLIGLPPTLDEIDAFVGDPAPDDKAFSKVVDRLLESPHYGERWGRHWLDLVRYAETNSFERDAEKPNAWKYRDYVIRSFNDDKPYDEFIREQIAGDELDQVTEETLTATGYFRLGIWDDEPADPLQARFDEFDDLISTTGQAILGLTINCARCHDHKIDPIPQSDYYSMLAFLADVTSYGTRRDLLTNNQVDVSSPELIAQYHALDEKLRKCRDELHAIEQASIAKMPGKAQRATEGPPRDRQRVLKEKLAAHTEPATMKRYRRLKSQLRQWEHEVEALPPRQAVLGLAQTIAQPETTFILHRGNPTSPTDAVSPAYPSIFAAAKPDIPEPSQTDRSAGRRRVLADWMTDRDNFLTPRVITNRIWQNHFGRGIVRSSNNFGRMGTPPTHPELLDYLSRQLMAMNWQLKPMHRLIMSSRAYRMSSVVDGEVYRHASQVDAGNDLFWHFDARRLSAEEVRDSILAASGGLNRAVYGPSVYPSLSPEVMAGQSRPGKGWGKSSPHDQNRRSVYIHVKRSLLVPMLTAFDFPDPDQSCEARFQTLGPNQALAMLNGQWSHQQASKLVDRAQANDDPSYRDFVRRTVRYALGRDASETEIAAAQTLRTDLHSAGLDERQTRNLFALSVLNWNEFLFLD